jgi:hypothetical protein
MCVGGGEASLSSTFFSVLKAEQLVKPLFGYARATKAIIITV